VVTDLGPLARGPLSGLSLKVDDSYEMGLDCAMVREQGEQTRAEAEPGLSRAEERRREVM
jgi:hypothetical protein